MLILTEENHSIKNQIFQVPDKLMEIINSELSKTNDSSIDGYDRANFIISSKGRLNTEVMKRIKNYFDHFSGNEKSFNLIGGNLMKNWVEKSLENARFKSGNDKTRQREIGNKTKEDSIVVPYIRNNN